MKHLVIRATLSEVWELERSHTAKVFKVNKGQ